MNMRQQFLFVFRARIVDFCFFFFFFLCSVFPHNLYGAETGDETDSSKNLPSGHLV